MAKETINDIKAKLIEKGYTQQELDTKTKPELVSMLKSIKDSEAVLSDIKEVEDTIIPPIESGPMAPETGVLTIESPSLAEEIPSPTSPEWTDYVLKLFIEQELDNGNPKADGLRRVAELIMGPFDIITNVVDAPTIQNANRATVVVQLVLQNPRRIVSGAADVYSGNTAKEFANHAVATAETRAEGRALRKALRLTKVITAEEAAGAGKDEADGNDTRIPQSMLSGLRVMTNRAGIDLHKLAVYMKYDIEDVAQLTQAQGLAISNQIVKFNTKEEEIPDVVKQ